MARETAQGTRVASPVVGTLNGPKLPPTETQTGGNTSIGLTAAVTQLRGWPANISRLIRGVSGSRTMAIRTDSELQTGPAPGRIPRTLFERNRGYIAENFVSGFPYNAEFSTIPHQNVPRRPMTTGPNRRMVDDNAPIPAIYSGNPRTR